jgi:hypothetical protein
MDNLVSILRMPGLNADVKTKILRQTQNWSLSFEGRPNLRYVSDVYKDLQNEGACVSCRVTVATAHVSSTQASPFLRRILPRPARRWSTPRRLRNGSTPKSVFGAALLSLSRIGSTTAATAARCSTSNVRRSFSLFLILVSRKMFGCVIRVIPS